MAKLEISTQNADVNFTSLHDANSKATANCDLVTGLRLAPGVRIELPELFLDDDVVVQTLEFPDDVSERIVAFFDRYLVNDPQAATDCHSFAWHAKGWQNKVDPELHKKVQYGDPLPFTSPRSGEAYGIQAADGTITHSILGTSDPKRSLSVLGLRSPLALASYTDLDRVYQGHTVTLGVPTFK
jgi:hypothetical protein